MLHGQLRRDRDVLQVFVRQDHHLAYLLPGLQHHAEQRCFRLARSAEDAQNP